MSWLVLLVEDDDDIRDTLSAILQARGFRVIAARHGREAIDRVRARGARPACVVLDLMMPVMDGEAFLAEQPNEPLLANVPVIIVTAQLQHPPSVPDQVRAIVMKPIRVADVLDAIHHACSDVRVPRPTLATGTGSVPGRPSVLIVSPAADSNTAAAASRRPATDPGGDA